jgi:hypothetical protein
VPTARVRASDAHSQALSDNKTGRVCACRDQDARTQRQQVPPGNGSSRAYAWGVAQRFDITKVTGAVAAALARGERTSSIVSDLQAGTLDGLPGVEMSQRNAWRYIERARKRLTAPDEPQGGAEGSFLAELEARVAERERANAERVEVRVEEARTQAAPAPAPPPRPAPSPGQRARQLLDALGVEPTTGYLREVAGYLGAASSRMDLLDRMTRIAEQHE